MRMFLLAAPAMVGLLALPASAEGVATAQPASLTRGLEQPGKLYCRFMTHEGMVVGRPVCLTRQGWEMAGYKARKEFSDFQHRHYSR